MPLPALGRALYTAQAHIVQSTLKELGRGEATLLLGEVGTGKSTMALAVAAALTPTHYAATRAALRAAGCWDTRHAPRPVERLLVLCPPHLLASWTEQVALTLPDARVALVRGIADLHAPPLPAGSGPGAGLTVYILSRETAKLGHATQAALAAHDTCPRCGAPVPDAAARIVSKRLRCRHQALRARHPVGAVAVDLAHLLRPVYPTDATIQALVPERVLCSPPAAEDAADDEAPEDSTTPTPAQIATQQATWEVQAGRRWDHAQTRLGRLLTHLTAVIRAAQAAPGPALDEPLRGLLRAALLLHLAAPPSERATLITQTVTVLTTSVPTSALLPYSPAALVQEICLRLLLLVPDDPATVDRLLSMLGPLVDGGMFTRTRARLTAEAAGAMPTRSAGPDWWEFTIPASGVLTWREGGTSLAAGSATAAHAALEILIRLGRFVTERPCDEPLYTAVPQPRRVPLARYIARHCRHRFGMVLLDELQEFNNVGSAQEHAAHLLAGLPGVALVGLTGSLMGGYVSSLFANFRAFSRAFRAEFGPHDRGSFVTRFGYLKILKTLPDKPVETAVREYGKASLRTEYDEDPIIRVLGEAPGVLPAFLPHYLLPIAGIIHKTDLECALPPLQEQPVALTVAPDDPAGRELLAHYGTLQRALLAQIAEDRFSDLQGRLLGALTELPGFLDLATADVGNARDPTGQPVYEVRYSAHCGARGGPLVAAVPLLPAGTVLPKERWLVEQLRAQLDRGRNVLVYMRHTGNSRLIARYQRLIRQRLGVDAAYLDSAKVDTKGREAWLKHEVIGRRQRVLLVNPEAVKTGLNCRTPYFTTAIWVEGTYNALTYRQANGRIHRIGSDPATTIEIAVPFYAGTAQETACALLARKVTVSTQMDGLDIESQLEAAGAGAGDEAALDVLSMGQALYEILSGQAATPAHRVAVPHVVQPPTPAAPPSVTPAARPTPTLGPPSGRPQQLSLFDPPPTGPPALTLVLPAASATLPQQGRLFDPEPATPVPAPAAPSPGHQLAPPERPQQGRLFDSGEAA